MPLIILVLVLLTSTVSLGSGSINAQEPKPVDQDWTIPPVAPPVTHTTGSNTVIEPIDVCVAYTQAAADYVQSEWGYSIERRIALAFKTTNEAFAVSGAPELSFRLLSSFQVDYQEPHDTATILDNLQQGAGNLSLAHATRDELGCDILTLRAYYPGMNGLAYLLTADWLGPQFAPWAVNVDRAGVLWLHETGHNLGGGHEDSPGVAPYARGAFYGENPLRGTIMAPGAIYWSNVGVTTPEGWAIGDAQHCNICAFRDVSWVVAQAWNPREVSDEEYIYLVGGLQRPTDPTAITTVTGFVLSPEAFVDISVDGNNWVEADVSGHDWTVDIDLPPDATELYAKVNSGAPVTIEIEWLIIPNAVIQGTVTDAPTGMPLVGAVVETDLGGFAVTTNDSGFYTLEVGHGSQTITVDHTVTGPPRKVYHGEAAANPNPGDTIQMDFNLTPTIFDNLIFLPLIQRGG